MRRCVTLLAALAACLWLVPAQAHRQQIRICTAHHPPVTRLALDGVAVTVVFSPQGGGEKLIVQAMDTARHRILMQAYSFTDQRIFAALGRAVARGVVVNAIVDRSDTQPYHGRPSVAAHLATLGVAVWVDDTVETAHNKVLVLDDSAVITGSYNFTYAADERNAENLLYFRNAPAMTRAFIANWNWRRGCSRRYAN